MSLSSKPYKRADETQLEALKAKAPTDPHVLNRDIRLLLAGAGGACVGSCSSFCSCPPFHSHSLSAAPRHPALCHGGKLCSAAPKLPHTMLPPQHRLTPRWPTALIPPHILRCTPLHHPPHNDPIHRATPGTRIPTHHNLPSLAQPPYSYIFLQRAAPPKRRRPRWSASRSSCSSKR